MRAVIDTNLAALAADAGGIILHGDNETRIHVLVTDSRECRANDVFAAIRGERFDGHDFIADLCLSGSIAAFITEDASLMRHAAGTGIGVILCGSTLAALGRIGTVVRRRINPRVTGITGTNGKTTTKEILAHILSYTYRTHRSEKNYNNEIGVPFALMSIPAACEAAVIEMGMNHAGEIERLTAMVEPDIAVITSVGEGHLEFLGSVENVAAAKAEIMTSMKSGSPVLINADSACCEFLTREAVSRKLKTVTFGTGSNADFHPDSYSLDEQSIYLTFGSVSMKAPLYGVHNVSNTVAAIAAAREYGMAFNDIAAALEGVENIGGRSAVIHAGYTIIDDTYNANPLSTRCALESVRQIYPHRRKIAVLSDMKELGDASELLHEKTGMYAACCGFDMLFLWGDMSAAYRSGAVSAGMDDGDIYIFQSKDVLTAALIRVLDTNDVILIKGSRSMKMEEISRALQ